jgi:3,2-trans-enoyl-CoA isomerase
MSKGDPVKRKPFTIGLNETKLGIVAPSWFADTFGYVVGPRHADILLQTGALLTAEKALAVGMVDEAVEHGEVVDRAVAKVGELLAVPDRARHASKMLLRGPIAERLEAKRHEDIDGFVAFCTSPPVQASLTKYLEALKKRK